jgi:rare lipoprotein A
MSRLLGRRFALAVALTLASMPHAVAPPVPGISSLSISAHAPTDYTFPSPSPSRSPRRATRSRRPTTIPHDGGVGSPSRAAGTCVASWYGEALRGRFTASGERFNPDDLTAAHRSMAFGTRLEVRHGTARVVVRITDRGPARRLGRCLDLSAAAFARLAPLSRGLIRVTWEVA